MPENLPFSIYNASAGSGKTYTLVKEYLKILFKSNHPDLFKRILAITFTNKAVAEMKERVIGTLKKFSDPKVLIESDSMFETICEELQMHPKVLREKSETLLQTIIHNYAAFDISTIDGFTHKLIRTFAYDLKLPVNFEVELDQDALLNEAVDSLIAKAGTNKQLTDQLTNWIDNNLLGSYQLKSTSGDFQGLVANLVQKITSDPKQTQASFQTILTNASKLALDPESEPARDPLPGQTAGNNTAPFKVTNNIATAGNMELNLRDPQQRQIYDRIIRDKRSKNVFELSGGGTYFDGDYKNPKVELMPVNVGYKRYLNSYLNIGLNYAKFNLANKEKHNYRSTYGFMSFDLKAEFNVANA